MSSPSDRQVAARIAAVEERLRRLSPLCRVGTWALYRGNDGIYVVVYPFQGRKTYLLISPNGEIRDVSGQQVDRADTMAALTCFEHAGLSQMQTAVRNWQQRRPGLGGN